MSDKIPTLSEFPATPDHNYDRETYQTQAEDWVRHVPIFIKEMNAIVKSFNKVSRIVK